MIEGLSLKAWLYAPGNGQYLLINAVIGIGIAADAVIATIGRFKRFTTGRDALAWAAAVGLTHTVFPMIGLIGLWYAASSFPSLKAGIYGAGFLAMVWFINDALREVVDVSDETDREVEEADDARDLLYQLLSKHSRFWAAVWAVSIDALVTGPGKTAATAHWSQAQVLGSFPLVGSIVFGLVILSAWPAIALRHYWQNQKFDNPRGFARFTTVGFWVELSIFLYFAYLAVAEMLLTLGLPPLANEFLISGLLTLGTILGLLATLGSRVWGRQLNEAKNLLKQ
ncbi:MAG: hypothetical protein AAF722_19280 [Cyanobacteria bacterium P01_C01_bin.70]